MQDDLKFINLVGYTLNIEEKFILLNNLLSIYLKSEIKFSIKLIIRKRRNY